MFHTLSGLVPQKVFPGDEVIRENAGDVGGNHIDQRDEEHRLCVELGFELTGHSRKHPIGTTYTPSSRR